MKIFNIFNFLKKSKKRNNTLTMTELKEMVCDLNPEEFNDVVLFLRQLRGAE